MQNSKVDAIEFFEKYTIFAPPNIYTREIQKKTEQQFNSGLMAQVVSGIPVNEQNSFFIKLFYQRDVRVIFTEPEIKLDRIGITLSYRCMFECDCDYSGDATKNYLR